MAIFISGMVLNLLQKYLFIHIPIWMCFTHSETMQLLLKKAMARLMN